LSGAPSPKGDRLASVSLSLLGGELASVGYTCPDSARKSSVTGEIRYVGMLASLNLYGKGLNKFKG
jgi:hypothetical protein